VEVRRHPPDLGAVLADLKTYSLFASSKVVLVVDSAALADRTAAGELIDAAADALPLPEGGELPQRARPGATRLLQALRLFEVDPTAGEPGVVVGELPAWALQGGTALRRSKPRGRGKKQVEELRTGLAQLLAAALAAGIEGWAEGDQAELAAASRDGLPEGHALVLAERAAAADHPVVASLAEAGAVLAVGGVTSERGGGWQGLSELARELERQTGVAITRDALEELARRTLRQERQGAVEAESTARLAGEYRKLATLSGGRRIDRAMVEEAVGDRGQEDVWKILDAVGAGRGDEALARLGRLLAGSSDLVGTRLSFFGLLASFCRQLTAIRGMMRLASVPAGERHYGRFKARLAPRLQGELPDGAKSPLAGLHPYRLHRAYLAACRVPEEEVAILPWVVLETEMRLKGESDDPDAALAALVTRLTLAGDGSAAAAGGRSGGRSSGRGASAGLS
jgi:DNA polymerase III delta subunit